MQVAFIINLSLSWLYNILHDNLARFLAFAIFIKINFFGKTFIAYAAPFFKKNVIEKSSVNAEAIIVCPIKLGAH